MRRIRLVACTAIVLLSGLLASRSAAQVHVDFGFGHGHHRHHHGWHHGWNGYGWNDYGWNDYGWYPRYAYRPYDYVYVAPAPLQVVAPQATYVQPSSAVALQSTVDLPPAPPPNQIRRTAPPNTLPANVDRRIAIRNSVDSGSSVFFVINGTTEFELAPGEIKVLNDRANCSVEFDRGGEFGTATHELSSGTYEFAVTDQGWDLQRTVGDNARTASRVVRKNALPK